MVSLFQISFDIGFASDNVREVVLRVHERHQSVMNQQWNLKDTFLLSPDGFWQFYTYEVFFVYISSHKINLLHKRFSGNDYEKGQHKKAPVRRR